MMVSHSIAFVTMAVILSAGICKSYSVVINNIKECVEVGLCEEKPTIYDDYQLKIDEQMESIYKKWPSMVDNLILDWLDPSENTPNNCKTESKIMQPYVYKGNTTKLVVQSKFYEQKFKTATCKKRLPEAGNDLQKRVQGEKCFESMHLENIGYEGICNPKQTIIKLYVYDLNKNEIQRVPVTIDVCCTCDITSSYDDYDK